MFIRHFFISFTLLFFFICGTNSEVRANSLQSNSSLSRPQTSLDIAELSHRLKELQTKLEKIGCSKIYLGGGSSRAILEHLQNGRPLTMRDLDVFIVLGREVTEKEARQIGESLQSANLGYFSAKDLRPRMRGNPALKGPLKYKYNAGFGFFLTKEGQPDLDLSIYHSDADLRLNGLLDIDKIMIPIHSSQNLKTLGEEISVTPYEELIKKGIVEDLHHGYKNWLAKKARIINITEFERDPILHSIRLTRSYAKLGYQQLPDDILKTLLDGSSEPKNIDHFQILRNLLKMLEDTEAPAELKILSQLGIFKHLSPGLDALLKRSSKNELHDLMSSQDPKEKFWQLLEELSPQERLPFLKPLIRLNPENGMQTLRRIAAPREGSPALKIGHFTGEFAPFHHGHLSVARNAIDRGGLDLMIVIPTPHATNDPKTARFSLKEWRERIDFVSLGTAKEADIIVMPNLENFTTKKGGGNPTLKAVIEELTNTLAHNNPLTHVAGGDSLHRIVARDLLTKDPRPRIVLTRPGVSIPKEAMGVKELQILDDGGAKPISATAIIHELAAGIIPRDLAPEVLEKVKATPRYQRIIKTLREESERVSTILKRPLKQKKGDLVYIVTPDLNPGGLIRRDNAPDASYQFLLEELIKNKEGTIQIFLDPNELSETTINEWKQFVLKIGEKRITITHDYSAIPKEQRVRVWHSGVANNLLEEGRLSLNMQEGQRFIFFETSDAPLSSLLRHPQIQVISLPAKGQLKCGTDGMVRNSLTRAANELTNLHPPHHSFSTP